METSMRKALLAKTVKVKNIKPHEIDRMYALFSEYYSNHSLESFERDLFEKNHVIILRDKRDESLQGFSTLLRVPLMKEGQSVIGVYSGDTVINKEYWGSPALGIEFLKYLWKLKIKKLGTPVYWFLISKGYKTYLLMANNFSTYYPRFDQATPPAYKSLMNEFYIKKFGADYHEETGIITHKGISCALKEHIADITPELLKEPQIGFFQKMNPEWTRGDELTCVAKMTLWMPMKYMLKKTLKVRLK